MIEGPSTSVVRTHPWTSDLTVQGPILRHTLTKGYRDLIYVKCPTEPFVWRDTVYRRRHPRLVHGRNVDPTPRPLAPSPRSELVLKRPFTRLNEDQVLRTVVII